jgi:DNA-directed RNA polymerase sigma subunit (sigma70/sigma32)
MSLRQDHSCSFESPIGDEEDSHLGDFIEDKNAILPIDAAIQSNLRADQGQQGRYGN